MLEKLAKDLVEKASASKIFVVTVESFAGGLVSSLITFIAGSSAMFERGYVTYSYESKQSIRC